MLREQIIFFIRETASTDQAESILGAWCIASHDIDRQVGIHALKSWNDVIGQDDGKLVLDRALLPSLISFVQRTLLDPAGVYLYLNPAPPAVPQAPSKKVPGRAVPAPTMKREDSDTFRTKGEGDDENELDRKARLRVGAFRALTWILSKSTNYVVFSSFNPESSLQPYAQRLAMMVHWMTSWICFAIPPCGPPFITQKHRLWLQTLKASVGTNQLFGNRLGRHFNVYCRIGRAPLRAYFQSLVQPY